MYSNASLSTLSDGLELVIEMGERLSNWQSGMAVRYSTASVLGALLLLFVMVVVASVQLELMILRTLGYLAQDMIPRETVQQSERNNNQRSVYC